MQRAPNIHRQKSPEGLPVLGGRTPLVRCALTLLLAFCAMPVIAAQERHCVDRLNSAGPTDRIAQASYRCLQLREGSHIWVAQAGAAHLPVVVLVHGMGNNAHRDWRTTFQSLSRQFHVIAFDLPGFGASQSLAGEYSFAAIADTLRQITDQLGIQRFHLVGHSLGAAASLYFAHVHPPRVDRLVLVDVAGVLLRPVFLRQLADANLAAAGFQTLDEILEVTGVAAGEGAATLFDLLDEHAAFAQLLARSPFLKQTLAGGAVFPEAALTLLAHDFSSAVREVAAPTVIIWGSEDTVTPVRTGQLLAGTMQRAQLRVIEGARHMPMNERPDAFNGELFAALSGPPPKLPQLQFPTQSQGHARCEGRSGVTYSGTYDSITLENCAGARMSNVRTRSLVARRSSIVAENLHVISTDVALSLQDAVLTLTVGRIGGRIAIQADNSKVDFAGVTLRAVEQAVSLSRASRVYFSVSEINAPDHRGSAHFTWPPRPIEQAQNP